MQFFSAGGRSSAIALASAGEVRDEVAALFGELMELFGPIFWAALIVLAVQAALFENHAAAVAGTSRGHFPPNGAIVVSTADDIGPDGRR
jgi:hypothetical protein